MSDFLARLIDRTLDRGPKLERRQPSIFEPATNAQPSGMAARAEIEETIEEVEAAPSGGRRARPARRPEPEPQSPVFEEAGDGRADPPRPPGSASPPPERSKAGDGALPRPVPQQIEIEQPAKPAPPAQELRLDRTMEAILEVQHVERERIVVEEQRIVEKAPAERVIRQEARIDRTILMPTPAPREKESGPVMPAALRIPRVPEAAQPAAPARRSPQLPLTVPAPPAPTITVSIGKVEIRAAQPASPPRPSRPAMPKLSLEDYLRRRTGGVQ